MAKKKTEKKAVKKQEPKVIVIPPIKIEKMTLNIIGDTPLLMHRFSEKAKNKIREKQTGKANRGKGEARKPEEECMDAAHMIDKKTFGFPAEGFKKAAVTACTSLNITKVQTRQAFHVIGDVGNLVKIKASKPVMREDTVRIPSGATLRYRPEFDQWSAKLSIVYNKGVVSAEQVANIFNTAGFAVGIGEWRPERSGQFGMFHVE